MADNTFAAKKNGFNSFNQRRLIDKFNYLVRSESDFMIGLTKAYDSATLQHSAKTFQAYTLRIKITKQGVFE